MKTESGWKFIGALFLWFASMFLAVTVVESFCSQRPINFADGRWTAKVWNETNWSKPPLVDVEIGLRNDGVICWRQARTNKP